MGLFVKSILVHLEKIAQAKSKLMLEHPYIGSVATALKLENNAQKALTFFSDGISLYYNGEYFDTASVEEITFALANGAMHSLFKHDKRLDKKVTHVWQAATDLVVNHILVQNGFTLPPYAYFDERFKAMYAEEIYDILKDEMNMSPDPNDEEAEEASQQTQENKVETYTDKTQATLEEYFEQIFQKYKHQGELPKDLQFLVPEYFSNTLDWKDLLHQYIAVYAKSTYSFMPPHMKYLYRGIYLPSLSSNLLRIVIAVDTSGSIDETLLATFLAEVHSIMQIYTNYEIELITADAKIQSHKTFFPGEMLDYTLSGGGGTDFRPVFHYIDENLNYPTLLLYFTDGEGTFPLHLPHYDVLWVMPKHNDVPFGEVLVL